MSDVDPTEELVDAERRLAEAEELAKKETQLAIKLEANGRRARELAERMGIGLRADSYQQLQMQLLIESVLPRGTIARVDFELECAEAVARSLEEAASQATLSKLTLPGR